MSCRDCDNVKKMKRRYWCEHYMPKSWKIRRQLRFSGIFFSIEKPDLWEYRCIPNNLLTARCRFYTKKKPIRKLAEKYKRKE